MSLYDLTGNKVSFTYGRLVQIASGSYYDGFGNPLNLSGSGTILTTGSTYPITSSWANNVISSSYSLTSSYSNSSTSASYALNSNTSTNVSGGTVNVTNITASNISSSTISASNYYGINATFNNITSSGPIYVSGSNAYIQLLPVGNVTIPSNTTASYIYVSGSTNDLYFTQYQGQYTNTTRLRWIEGNMYSGLLHGGILSSVPGSTTFNLSSGSGIIVSLNASINSDPYPTIKFVNWNNFVSQSLPYINSNIQTYIGIDANGQILQQPSAFNDGDYNNFITIGTVIHQNYSTVNATITYPNVAYGYKQRTYDFIKSFGGLKLSGYELAVSASSTGSLIIGPGNAWADGRNYQNDPNSPSYITDAGTNVSKIFRYYVSGSVDYQDTNLGLGYESIDPTRYNNNGILTTVTGTSTPTYKWTIQRVFYYPNSATKGIVVYYGNAEYATQAEAIANIPYEKFSETGNTKANAIFIGWLIVRKDCNFTDSTTYKLLQGGLFRSVGGSGGGGTVSLTLASLSDVTISNPQQGQPLTYDSASAYWINSNSITASLYGTASNSISSSYALTASFALNGGGGGTTLETGSTYPITSSWSNNTVSASYASTSSYAVTASYALNSLSASYCINPFPISGSLGYWGSFWDTTTQTNVSSSNVMRLNNTDPDSNGVSIESGSRIKFTHDGVYNLQFSAVFTSDNASSNDVNVWFSKNGQTLTDSNTVLTVGGQSNAVAAWNYVLKLYSNDYIELYWRSLESTMKIEYLPTQSIVVPATPSLIVTATQVTNTQIAPSASYALTASYALNAGGTTLITGSTYPITASWANNVISSSYALSASYSPGGASLSGGTTNYIPLWTSTTTLATSSIYQSGNSIGIGTTSPSVKVDVVGDVQANAFYGKSFNLTTTSGESAIFDTFTSTGTGEVYEVVIKGNPNAGESSNYQDVIYGKIIIGTGKTGSIATTFINYVQESPDPRLLYSSGGTSLTASVYFNSASISTTQKGVGESTQIRIVVGSYAVGYVGNNTTVRLKQIL